MKIKHDGKRIQTRGFFIYQYINFTTIDDCIHLPTLTYENCLYQYVDATADDYNDLPPLTFGQSIRT